MQGENEMTLLRGREMRHKIEGVWLLVIFLSHRPLSPGTSVEPAPCHNAQSGRQVLRPSAESTEWACLLGKVVVPTIRVFRDLLSNEKEALIVQNQTSFKVLQGIKGRARFLTNFRVSLALGYSSMTEKRPPKSVVCSSHSKTVVFITPHFLPSNLVFLLLLHSPVSLSSNLGC